MRVNRFMLEMGIRKMISSMLEPVYLSQNNLELKMIQLATEQIVQLTVRLDSIEEDLYNKETKDDKVSKLETRIQEVDL
jgi:hypothetical protein